MTKLRSILDERILFLIGPRRVGKEKAMQRFTTNLSRYATILFFLALSSVPSVAQVYGGLFHTIRYPDGAWQPFGDVKGQAGDPGPTLDVSAAGNNSTGDLHLLVSTYDGGLFHTIRYANGTWQPFYDVKGQAGDPDPGNSVTNVSGTVNNSTDELHLVISTYDGGLFHTIRRADGTWQPFGDVKGQAGNPGSVTDVSATFNNSTGELHLVVSTYDGGLFHTIRHADGTWEPFGDVKGQAGDPGFGKVGVRVGTALVGGSLHVLASTQTGGLFHTIRYANGTWQPFYDVEAQAGNPGPVFEVSAAGNDSTGELQVVAVAGKPWHTIRLPNGTWSRFGDVTGQVGDPSACGYGSVGTDLIGGSLHLAAATNEYCLQ